MKGHDKPGNKKVRTRNTINFIKASHTGLPDADSNKRPGIDAGKNINANVGNAHVLCRGAHVFCGDTPDKRRGTHVLCGGTPAMSRGARFFCGGTPDTCGGAHVFCGDTPDKCRGTHVLYSDTPDKRGGAHVLYGGVPDKRRGVHVLYGGTPETYRGIRDTHGGAYDRRGGSFLYDTALAAGRSCANNPVIEAKLLYIKAIPLKPALYDVEQRNNFAA